MCWQFIRTNISHFHHLTHFHVYNLVLAKIHQILDLNIFFQKTHYKTIAKTTIQNEHSFGNYQKQLDFKQHLYHTYEK